MEKESGKDSCEMSHFTSCFSSSLMTQSSTKLLMRLIGSWETETGLRVPLEQSNSWYVTSLAAAVRCERTSRLLGKTRVGSELRLPSSFSRGRGMSGGGVPRWRPTIHTPIGRVLRTAAAGRDQSVGGSARGSGEERRAQPSKRVCPCSWYP